MFNSIVFSPVIVAVYVTVIFSVFSPTGLGSMDIITSIILGVLFLSFFPIIAICLDSENLKNWDISEKEKRSKPYAISIISYISASVIFWFSGNYVMFLISISYVTVASTMFLINSFWKISAHTSGIAGPVTSLVCVFGLGIAPMYLFLLPVAYSRYKLNSHDSLQLLAGALLGIFITYFTYFILW